jgi:hypothetical protein
MPGKAVENDETIKEICAATRKTIPGIVINKIRWLHDAKGHEERLKAGKMRGTAIVSLPTQALQVEMTHQAGEFNNVNCSVPLPSISKDLSF